MIVLSALVILKVPSGSDMVSMNRIHVSHIMLVAGLKRECTCMIFYVLVFVECDTIAQAVSCPPLVKCHTIAQAVNYPPMVQCGII